MNKIIFSLIQNREDNTAGSKAKDDITRILTKKGFIEVKLFLTGNKPYDLLANFVSVIKSLKKINGAVIVFQYPIYSKVFTSFLIPVLKRFASKKIVIIHDLEMLRDDKKAGKKETSFINAFDYAVVHNKAMYDFLKDHGVSNKKIILELFDYLTETQLLSDFKNHVDFAGNLRKAEFLTRVKTKTVIQVFGPNPAQNYPENIEYRGQYAPNVLGEYLDGKFGLIWDGNSAETGSGIYGKYMKVNNPHKASLYLSLGKPVIVWSESAISEFVEKWHVGISLNSLNDMDMALNTLTEKDYLEMVSNARKVSKLVRNGHFTLKAIDHCNVEF